MLDLSYQEKNSLVSLLTLVVLGPIYFVRAFRMIQAGDASALDIVLFNIGWLVLLTAVEVVCHILIAIRSRQQPQDERDRLIALRSSRNAYLVLIVGAVGVIGHVFAYALFDPLGRSLQVSGLMTAYVLIFLLTLAEVVQLVSRLVYYRRGV